MKAIDYFRYSTPVWLTSLVVSPAILMVGLGEWDLLQNPLSGLGFMLLAVLYGGLLSFLNWLLLTLGVALTDRLRWSEPARRLVLQLWATALTFGLFYFVFDGRWGNTDCSDNFIPLTYFATISFGIWVYDLEPGEPEEEIGGDE